MALLVALPLTITLGLAPAGAAGLITNTTPADTSGGYATQSGNTYFAYVQAGEWVYAWGDGGTAHFYDRDGQVYSGSSYGATAFHATSSGVWTFAFGGAGNWNVTVYDGDPGWAAGTDPLDGTHTLPTGVHELTGRVWTNSYKIYQGSGSGAARDLDFYLLNDSGYEYDLELTDYSGIQSSIGADSLGIPADGMSSASVGGSSCVPSYRSWDNPGSAGAYVPGACARPFRLFFEAPSGDLPASAPRWDPAADGGAGAQVTQVIKPNPLTAADLTVHSLTFDPDPGAASGTFHLDLGDFFGSAKLEIDTNGDGDYTDAVDRTVRVGAAGAPVAYDFDGLDGNGDAIATCQAMNARVVFDRVGEVHVLQDDVEGRGGIELTRTNGPGAPDSTIYWDDTQTGARGTTTPDQDGTAGVDSSGGVHGWAYSSSGWGNEKVIDDWTFAPIGPKTSDDYTIGHECFSVAKSQAVTRDGGPVAAGDPVQAGDVVTYTVTGTNNGTSDYTAADPAVVVDDLSGVLDDASLTGSPTASVDGTAVAAPTLTGGRLVWSGPLAAGKTVTVTYRVTIPATAPAGGDGVGGNVAFAPPPGTTPGDAGDPSKVPTPPAGACAAPTCAPTGFTIARLDVQKYATLSKDANGNGEADAGDQISYSFTVSNTGGADATGVSIDDARLAAAGVSVSPASQDVPVGATVTFTAGAYTVTQDDVDAGDVANSATAGGTIGGAPYTSPPASRTVPGPPAVPELTLKKTGNLHDTVIPDGRATPGETITYSFAVTNTGNVTIKGVHVNDPRVSGVTPASVDLAPGDMQVFTADYTVTSADLAAGKVTNSATATGLPVRGTASVTSPPSSFSLPTTIVGGGCQTGVDRIGGRNRYGTAARLSQRTYRYGAPVVYVASGEVFPDALGGGVAAGYRAAPLLLVKHNAIPRATRAELERLAPKRIVVLGQTTAVNRSVARKLAAFASGRVTRIGGADRYATAAKVANRTFGNGAKTAYLASGVVFADALSGGPSAVLSDAPMLLTKPRSLPRATTTALHDLGVRHVVLLGGRDAVSAKVAKRVRGAGISVKRIAGANRYATSVAVAKYTFPDLASPTCHDVFVATGQAFPDALTGGAVASQHPAPVLLTPTSHLVEVTGNEVLDYRTIHGVVLGQTAALSRKVEGQLIEKINR